MKKSILVAGLFQIAVALVLAAPAVAQDHYYTIHVPFSFNVQGHALPAGDYRVGVISPVLVEMRRTDGSAAVTFNTFRQYRPGGVPQSAQLVFHRYGQRYFLAEAWFDGTESGYLVPRSRTEREFAKQALETSTVMFAAK
jgi:hypothetical protein